MEKSEAELLQLRETFRDKDDLKRYLLVDKMTDSDSSVKSYFGLPSVVTLFGIFAILDNLTPTLAYWKGWSGVYNATPENPSKKTGPNRKLTRFHEFLITLFRLRLALPTFVIADIFGITCTRVSQSFVTWINYMNLCFHLFWKDHLLNVWNSFCQNVLNQFFPKQLA